MPDQAFVMVDSEGTVHSHWMRLISSLYLCIFVVVHEVFLEAMVKKSECELSHVDIGVRTILCTQTNAYLDLHFPEEGGRRGDTLEFALTMIKSLSMC